ncbi:MAG: G protein-coupled receptor LGR4 [Chthoniobacter sp.]|uniref:leucine-rich repeat domain-containing protein n=1 Tax=Chthoniobacter sp. TaxID=2510640 RepID=UPI0032A2D31D
MSLSKFTFLLTLTAALALTGSALAGPPDLSKVTAQADLDAVVAKTSDAALKRALQDHAKDILAAAAQAPHVEAVARTVEGAKGKVERVNTTPEALAKACGGPIALFDTLKLVDLAVPNTGPHDKRESDPYDAAFFEHVGHLSALESLNVISTKFNDDWIAPIGLLTNLKKLSFTNNGKLTDAGMEKLAGLTNLETFSFVGTGITGRAYAKCTGWTKVTRVSHRGSSIDDEGLKQLCEHLPNLESISLAHAKFTDAGAPNLAKLTKLKGLELGAHATAAALKNLVGLPLEYLQLGEGFSEADSIAAIKAIPTLKRVTLTDCKKLDDAGLKTAANLKQLEQLELGGLELPDERLPQLQAFAFLKELKLIRRPQSYPEETQAKIKALLPKVDVKFQ